MPESVSQKLARFETALQLFLERVRADPNPLAAVLVGSLTEETVWRRDAISLWIIEKDGVTKRLRADGKDPRVCSSTDAISNWSSRNCWRARTASPQRK